MKNRKILAVLLSIAMICSSLPVYAEVDNVSSGSSLNTASQSSNMSEGTEGTGANQNDESSSQAEMETSSEASANEAVNNEENAQSKAETSSEVFGNEAINNEENAQSEYNNNILQQDVVATQHGTTEQSVYDLCNGDIDIYYENGAYYTTQDYEKHTDIQSPVIFSTEETKNQIHLHDFVPDEVNTAPYVIIRDLNAVSDDIRDSDCYDDSTILEIDGNINLQVENDCSLKTTSKTCAAIDVDENANLTISGSGSLYVSSSGSGAAIGASGVNSSMKQHKPPVCGNIEITGDVKVTAENTGNGAGIGGGYSYDKASLQYQYGGDVKNITIGGNASVTATSNGGSAAIGSGGASSQLYTSYEGKCSSITIKDNAIVKATANDTKTAAIGSEANGYYESGAEQISILDNANVYAASKYVAIGCAESVNPNEHRPLLMDNMVTPECDTNPATDSAGETGASCSTLSENVDNKRSGVLSLDDTVHLECYVTGTTQTYPILSQSKLADDGTDANFCTGTFTTQCSPEQQTTLSLVNADTNEYIKDICLPQNAASFAVFVPEAGNYMLLSGTDDLSSLPESGTIEKAVRNDNAQNFVLPSNQSVSDYSNNTTLVNSSVNLDLSQGSITVRAGDPDGIVRLEQNLEIRYVLSGQDNIVIYQSSDEATSNQIVIKGSVSHSQIITLDGLNVNSKHPIIVENGADVNLIFHNTNTLTGSNCKKSTDYPAIEVPGGATVTLSGDGSLEATANGYAAAIGTKGYYRDALDHNDGDKSGGTIQIDGNLNVKAHSAYGAGIGGGAISGSSCEQHAFDNGTVIIKGNTVVEAFGSIEGCYSAGIGGGGCYTSTCAAVGGDGGDVQILDNAQVTAACKGSFGAGIGGGGGCGRSSDGFGGEGESFKADNNAVVVATGSRYGPGIGGGGAQQKTCCATHPGDSGSCSVLGNSNVTARSGGKADNFGVGGHTGGWVNYKGSYTDPVVIPTATFIY